MRRCKFVPIITIMLLAAGYLLHNFFTTSGMTEYVKKTVEIPEQISEIKKEGIAPHKYIHAVVDRVIDGDTLEITYTKKKYKVRMLCVDTPESVKQGVKIQAYAKEALNFTLQNVKNQTVKLVFDTGLRDRYGRLLAYIILKDGTFLNAVLVRNGYARVEIVSPNNRQADYFEDLQEQAIGEKLGIWGLPREKQPFIKNQKGEYVPRYKLEQKAG